MSIDWAATGTWMQAWAGFAQAGVVVIAAVIAKNTFNAWRRQRIEERRIDVAERLLASTYKAKRAFTVIRSPITSQSALEESTYNLIQAGVDLEAYSDHLRSRVVESQVVFDRINSFSELWDGIAEITPVATALFGPRIEEIMGAIWAQKISVQVAAEQYPTDDGSDQTFSEDISSTIWENRQRLATSDDKVSARLATAIVALETILLPVMRTEP